MSSFVDFSEVKSCYSIVDVAERLGLELKKSGNQLRGPCPSGAEGERKFVITPEKNVWYSFALNEGGDVISLVALVRQCSAKEAAQWIVGDTEPEKKKRSKRTSSQERPERGFRPLDYLEPDHLAVESLGFTVEDATRIGAGYAPRGILRGTVAIPIRDETGKLLGYLGAIDVILPSQWH